MKLDGIIDNVYFKQSIRSNTDNVSENDMKNFIEFIKKETPKKEEPKKETKKKVAKKESTLESDLEHMRESASASYRSKVYHISLREDGKWQVKFAKGEKVIKTFATQKEAIDYAKKLAENQDGSISIHKKDGKIRKLKY